MMAELSLAQVSTSCPGSSLLVGPTACYAPTHRTQGDLTWSSFSAAILTSQSFPARWPIHSSTLQGAEEQVLQSFQIVDLLEASPSPIASLSAQDFTRIGSRVVQGTPDAVPVLY